MEQVEVALGERKTYGEHEDPREIVRFTGEKILELADPNHEDCIRYTLYKCSNGYRVLVELDIDLGDIESSVGVPLRGIHLTALAPSRKEGQENYLLTEEDVSRRFPSLPTAAGKLRNLDEVQAPSPEKRERAVRFARIMRLVHSTTT